MTVEQLKESYMFKIIKRALMKQYPWIKDVEIDEKDFDDYKITIFLNVYIDPYELGEEMGWEVARWVEQGYFAGTSVGMFFKGSNPEYRELSDEVNDFVDEIRLSPAIPDDLRIPPPKNSWSISEFVSTK